MMAILSHTINFYVTFGGANDFVFDGSDLVISDNTVTEARDEIRTIDQITRSPDVATYLPVSPLNGTDLEFEWWEYREAEKWTFNLWDTSTRALFAQDLCQTLYNSIHENIDEWSAVYGSIDSEGTFYPCINDLNVYIIWGKPLLQSKVATISDTLILPFFYRGKDPEHSLEFNINEKTV